MPNFDLKRAYDDAIEFLKESSNDFKEEVLLCAILKGREDVTRILMEHANVHCSNDFKETVLYYAVRNGWEGTTRHLIEHEIDVNAQDSEGDTPLHWAIEYKQEKMVELLFKEGADWNAVNNKGESPFYLLGMKGRIDEMRKCIEMGAYVEPSGYEQLLQVDSFKNVLLRDVKLCSQAIINKFNLKDLPAVKEVAGDMLPPISRIKIEKGSGMALEVERAIAAEIESKGHCDLLGTRTMVLSLLSVKSFIDYVKQSKERSLSSLNELKRSNSDVEGENSCKKVCVGSLESQ